MIRARDWSHGHSIGTGTLFGVLLSGHVWLIFVIGIVVGIALAYMRQTAAFVAGAWRERTANRREAFRKPPASVSPVLEATYRVSAQNRDGIPYP